MFEGTMEQGRDSRAEGRGEDVEAVEDNGDENVDQRGATNSKTRQLEGREHSMYSLSSFTTPCTVSAEMLFPVLVVLLLTYFARDAKQARHSTPSREGNIRHDLGEQNIFGTCRPPNATPCPSLHPDGSFL